MNSLKILIIKGDDDMDTTKEYRDFILEQLSNLEEISCKQMMGEYLLYYKKMLFGGIYDNRLLVKITKNNMKYNMSEAIPYDGAKPMFLVDDVDNKDVLENIILDTYNGLKK